MKTSEQLRQSLGFLDGIESSYLYYKNEVEVENKRTQDLLHIIEFDPDCKSRSKTATKLHNSRVNRREAKDKMNELEPIYEIVTSNEYKKIRNKFSHAMGDIRKFEKHEESREYYPRVKE